MESRTIGSLTVSVVGLGCNSFGTTFGTPVDEEGTRHTVHAALDAGITLFDTADIYGESEVFVGKALGSRRDEIVLATKFGGQIGKDPANKGASARWIEQAVENSLRRLGTDRIDLYQLHFPDPNTPFEETLTALDNLVKAGKVREIGSSNLSGSQIDEAEALSREKGLARFVSAQNDLSLLRQRTIDDVVPACVRNDVAVIPYSPLASGLLTGKYKRGQAPAEGTRLAHLTPEQQERSLSDKTMGRIERLDQFARDHGHTLIELAFGWLLAQPNLASVIAGATRPDQIASNVAACGWKMTPDEVSEAANLASS